MNILLVLPAAPHLRVTGTGEKVPPRKMLRFSVLPLTVVAALTPEKHTVTICDENVEPLDLASDVDLVGITFMTALANRAYEISKQFRRRGIRTVAGGFHPTLCPDDALPHFDAIVKGDAENAWPQLLRDAEKGALKTVYENTSPCSLAETPPPFRRLLEGKTKHYVTTNAVQAGRGCEHGCRYCSIAAFHKCTYRRRPIENVLRELKQIPRDFMFVDDNIISDPAYAAELFRAMTPLKKRWVSQCSLKIAEDPELLKHARRAGCRGLFIGIETLNKENLQSVGKEFNKAAAYKKQIRAIRKSGIGVIAGIIVGMDGDDTGVFERTLRFLQKTGIDAIQLNIMTPLPGTPLYRDMKQAGRITDNNWDHYDFRHCVIKPARMTAAELQDGADWLYRQFYRLDRILFRAVRTSFTAGFLPALLSCKLGLTYRFDNINEKIVGRNPAKVSPEQVSQKGLSRKAPLFSPPSSAPQQL